MWFKKTKLFQLTDSLRYSADKLTEKLEPLSFKPCRPSMSQSFGWVPPVDEEDMPLVQAINGYMMVCLQVEEKILPAIVVRQELSKRIKEIEKTENRTVRPKEKYALKDDMITTLLPRAFSKLTKVYAYIDTKNNWLVLGTTHEKKAEQFISMFKKSLEGEIHPFEIKNLSATMTHWLKNQSCPSSFSVEKSCMLQDPNQENRIIRCQQQDLFASSIQSLIKEGCEVKQLALNWQDRVDVVLSEGFSLSGIKFHDGITLQAAEMEAETAQQKFYVDFLIMSETLSKLLQDLLSVFIEPHQLAVKKAGIEPDRWKVIPMIKQA
jgi:recombination associated protein RdgC